MKKTPPSSTYILNIICFLAGMIFFEATCHGTSYAPCDPDKIFNEHHYEDMFRFSDHDPFKLSSFSINSRIFARIRITSKVKRNNKETDVHYSMVERANLAPTGTNQPKFETFTYSLKEEVLSPEGELVMTCPNRRFEALKVGSEYLFALSSEGPPDELGEPAAVYAWNDQVQKNFEDLKFFEASKRLKPEVLVTTIRTLMTKNPRKALILLSITQDHLPRSQIRSLTSQAFIANKDVKRAYLVLTRLDEFEVEPNATNLFSGMQLAIQLKKYDDVLTHLTDLLKHLGSKNNDPQATAASLDLNYWKSFIASSSFQLLKKDPKQLRAVIQRWLNLRTCGLGEGDRRVAWSKDLEVNRAIIACKGDPTGTVVWLSSLPMAANQNPELSVIVSKKYYLLRDPDLEKGHLVGIASFAKSREQEDWVATRKRVLHFTYSCPNARCKLNVDCALNKSQKTLVGTLPVKDESKISNLENVFMQTLYGVKNNSALFETAFAAAQKTDEEARPYLSHEGYKQMLQDVKTHCKI